MRNAKVDGNHRQILDALKQMGWSVCDTSRLGEGKPDAFIARSGRVIALEIKSVRGKPNAAQNRFKRDWRGEYAIVRTVEGALELIRASGFRHMEA